MKLRFRIFGYILFFFLGLQSCIEEVEGFSNSYEELIVVQSILSPQDSVLRVDVQKTIPLFDNTIAYDWVMDAEVFLINNGDTIELVYGVGAYEVKPGVFNVTTEEIYELVVVADGKTITSSCTIPKQINFTEREKTLVAVESNSNDEINAFFQVDFSWDDTYAVGTVYTEVKYTVFTYEDGIQEKASSQMPYYKTIKYSNKKYPEVFNTNNVKSNFLFYTASVLGASSKYDSISIFIEEVKHHIISSETNYERFFKSLENQNNSDGSSLNPDNPFQEPTVLFSNINNGIGVFGAFTHDTIIENINKEFFFPK